MKLSPALQEARKRFGIIEFKAVVGSNDQNNPDVPGWPGYVYVQLRQADGLSAPIPARWQAVCAKVVGQPVDVGYDHGGNLCVLRADFDGQIATNINPLGNNPADANVSNFINQSRITTLLSHVVSSASDSMLVTVDEYIYIKNGTIHWFLGGNGDGSTPIDLTSYIPATPATQCMAGLFLKSDDTIEVQVSSNIPASDPLWITEAQECLTASSAGSSFIWAYHLYYGQTTIVDGTKNVGGDTVLDFRQIVSLWGASGGAAFYQTVQDNGTPKTQRSNLNFIGATVADNAGNDSTDITISGGSLTVADGSTTVTSVTEIDFTSGATVTNAGGGVAQVAVTGGAGTFPKRATMWGDEFTSVTGAGVQTNHDTGTDYSYYAIWTTPANGDVFSTSFALKAGTYTLYILCTTLSSGGKIDFAIDGTNVLTAVDMYSAGATYGVIKSGSVTVATDDMAHVLTGTMNGKNGSSSDYQIAITKIWLKPAAD